MAHLHPPSAVLDIAERLERAGFEAWCVGGAIRDALLGHPHLDWDLATSATPAQVRELFGSGRTVPVGIAFGTIGVLDRHGRMHEVTTFRRDVRTDGRHAEVEFGVSLDDDLARRDFTINAIAYSPRTRELRDPFDGQGDIGRRVVRAVGDPRQRMLEDRLRALRAIRFAARFDFDIEPSTLAALAESAPYLGRLSPERVKQELDKTMEQVRCPSRALRLWQSTGAFATLIPALAGVPVVALTVPDFLAMPGPKSRPGRRAIRLAGLLVEIGARDATHVLTSLRASRQEIQRVGLLVDRWNTVGARMTTALLDPPQVIGHDQVRQWAATIGRLDVSAFMRLASGIWAARASAGLPAPTPRAVRALYRRLVRSAWTDPIDLGALAVDGDDLRRAGIPPGPGLGRILQALLTRVIEDPTRNTADWLLQEARALSATTVASSNAGVGGSPNGDGERRGEA